MKKNTIAALGAAFAVSLAVSPAAFAGGMGKDMKGNDVKMPENFTYGGDNTAGYAGGKMATGVKDPAVCGTFDPATPKCDGRPKC